jgi:hypothetical protein
MSFGGLLVRVIGFRNDHVKRDGEGFNYHQAHAAMVMILMPRDVWHGALKDFKIHIHLRIDGKDNDVIMMFASASTENNYIYLDFQNPHEV